MTTEPGTGPEVPGGGRAWLRPVALVVSCLVIGFVAGWLLRGDNGPVTVLAPAPSGDEAQTPVVTTGTGTGGTATTAPATTAATPPAPPPDRAHIALAVLNGTATNGLAAQTAGQAEGLGYQGVTTGNAPTTSDPTTVYFRADQRPAAQRVARDLGFGAVAQLPRKGAVADAAPADAEVVVVLGTG